MNHNQLTESDNHQTQGNENPEEPNSCKTMDVTINGECDDENVNDAKENYENIEIKKLNDLENSDQNSGDNSHHSESITCDSVAIHVISSSLNTIDSNIIATKSCELSQSKHHTLSLPSSTYAVDVSKLHYSSGRTKILSGINVKVPCGAIYCLIGPSGCGKTTLLRCVVGCLRSRSGSVKVFGNTPGSSKSGIPGPKVGYMPQESALWSDMTVSEILYYFGKLYSRPKREIYNRIEFLLSFLDMSVHTNSLVGTLSGGQTRRLSLAAALIHSPPLLILDEPTAGVDPLLRQSIWSHLKSLAHNEGITVIITTHYIEEARTATIVGLMRRGILLAQESPETLIQRTHSKSLEDAFLSLCITEEDDNTNDNAHDNPNFIHDSNDNCHVSSDHNENHNNCDQNHNLSSNNLNSSVISHDFSISESRHSYFGDFMKFWGIIFAIFWKNWIRNKRHFELILFQFFLPAFVVILFCYCIGAQPFHVPMAIVNDECPYIGDDYIVDYEYISSTEVTTELLTHNCSTDHFLSQRFLETIDPYLITQYNYPSLEDAIESVKSGNVWGAIHIPKNFSMALERRIIFAANEIDESIENNTVTESTIKIYADLTKKILSITVQRTLFDAFQLFVSNSLKRDGHNPNLAKAPIVLEKAVYGNDDKHKGYTEFMAPGILINFSFVMSAGLTSLIILLDRRDGMAERHLVCGVRPIQLILGHATLRLVTMAIQNAIVLMIVLIWLHLPVRGPIIWIFLLLLFQSCAGMSFGLFVASLCEQENAAAFLIASTVIINLTLCGMIWPIEAIPYYFRWFSQSLPSTIPTEALRGLLNRGWGIQHTEVQLGFLSTIAWFFIFTIAATKLFKFLKN